MPKYIDQDKLVNRLKECRTALVKERWFDDYVHGYSAAISDIMDEPTADVQEVKHGKWIRDDDQDGFRCPNCGHATNETLLKWYQEINGDTCNICYRSVNPFYCSRCGAKMGLED